MWSKVLGGAEAQRVERVRWTPATLRAEGGSPELVRAYQEIDQLREQLEVQKVAAERQAVESFQNGRMAGLREAEEATNAEMRALAARVSQSVAELGESRTRLLRDSGSDLIHLAIAIARRVLHREIATNPAALEALVGAALEKLENERIVKVRVNPAQREAIEGCLERLGRGGCIEVESDDSREPGAAVFELVRGNLDASIETQLREIERGLFERHAKESRRDERP